MSELEQDTQLKLSMLKDVQSRLSFLETRLDGSLKTIDVLGILVQSLEESLEDLEKMVEEQ